MLVVGVVLMTAAPAAATIRPDTRCSEGTVAMTFDDGPSAAFTPQLLEILRAEDAQATFFVLGRRAARHPGLLKRMVRDGHAVENHSWDHPALTTRDNRRIRRQIGLTQRVIRDAIGQSPGLFRPPYGDSNKRVRSAMRAQDLRHQLWTIDTRDWAGRSVRKIRRAALTDLKPHRPNVILMHDGVDNSGRTLEAVPGIVRGLRSRGYCLEPLEVMTPLATVSADPLSVMERTDGPRLVAVRLRLDAPAQRRGTLRLTSVGGSAVEGLDYRFVDTTITFERGARAVTTYIRVLPDPLPDATRRFTLRLSAPEGLRLVTTSVPVTITDDGQRPGPTTELIKPTA